MSIIDVDITIKKDCPSIKRYVDMRNERVVHSHIEIPFHNALEELVQNPEEYADYEFFHEYLHHFLSQIIGCNSIDREEPIIEKYMSLIAEYRPGFVLRQEFSKPIPRSPDMEHATIEELHEWFDAKEHAEREKFLKKHPIPI